MRLFTLTTVFVGFLAVSGSADALVLVKDGRPVSIVVLGDDPHPAERFAAEELIGHVRLMTGAELPLHEMSYGDIPVTGNAVLVGWGDWMEAPRFEPSIEELGVLGDQGIVVRDYADTEPRVLLVTGDGPRGVLYAAYELLHVLGVRWLTADVTEYPKVKTLDTGDLNIGDIPCFDVRGVDLPEIDHDPLWAARLRLSAGCGFMEDSLGCAPVYSPLPVTCGDLIPAELFEASPDLFPLVDGERRADDGFRCFGNPDCAEVAADRVLELLADTSNVTCITLDLPEMPYLCDCSDCREIREYEKKDSGLVLTWLNDVAGMVARSRPDILFELNVRGPLESPPTVVVPADNVLIGMAPDGVDLLYPVEDSVDERTMAFREHLRGWRLTGARLTVMHPCAHAVYPSVSFPDMEQLTGSVSLYHYEFVENCRFRIGDDDDGMYAADAELKAWLLSELMWNRYRDPDMLVREWMKGVYGNAWGAMFDYFRHVRSIAEKPNLRLTPETPAAEYITDEWLGRGRRMFQRAYAQSMTDETARRHVVKARLGFRFMRLVSLLDRFGRDGPPGGRDRERYLELVGEWLAECGEFGCQRVSDGETCGEFAARFIEALAPR